MPLRESIIHPVVEVCDDFVLDDEGVRAGGSECSRV